MRRLKEKATRIIRVDELDEESNLTAERLAILRIATKHIIVFSPAREETKRGDRAVLVDEVRRSQKGD